MTEGAEGFASPNLVLWSPPPPTGSGVEGELRLSRPARHRPPRRLLPDGPSVAGEEQAGRGSPSSAGSRAAPGPHGASCSSSGPELPPSFLTRASGQQNVSVTPPLPRHRRAADQKPEHF